MSPKVALLEANTEPFDLDTFLPVLQDEGEWLLVSLRGAVGWIQKRSYTLEEDRTKSEKARDYMRIDTINTESFSMNYCQFGQGQEALVIIPGLSVQSVLGFAEAIAESYQALAADFTIYVLDRINELPVHYSVQEMAEDTAIALQVLGLGPVCLFGASQGGMIAMKIAADHPELVKRLILGSTSAQVTEAQYDQIFEGWANMARAGDAASLYLAFGKAIYPTPMFEQSRQLLLDASKTVTEDELRRFAIQTEGMKDFDIREDLEKIACPVLVLGSRDDQVLGGEASEQIAEQIQDCELYMYDGYGHAVYDLAPDYRERMKRFLVNNIE